MFKPRFLTPTIASMVATSLPIVSETFGRRIRKTPIPKGSIEKLKYVNKWGSASDGENEGSIEILTIEKEYCASDEANENNDDDKAKHLANNIDGVSGDVEKGTEKEDGGIRLGSIDSVDSPKDDTSSKMRKANEDQSLMVQRRKLDAGGDGQTKRSSTQFVASVFYLSMLSIIATLLFIAVTVFVVWAGYQVCGEDSKWFCIIPYIGMVCCQGGAPAPSLD